MKTHNRSILLIAMLSLGCFVAKAQDYPSGLLDGPSFKPDSLTTAPGFMPSPAFPIQSLVQQPDALMIPMFETKEQRAARINQRTYNALMKSADQNLYWYRIPKISKTWKLIMGVGKLFLSNPFGFPEGYVPLMNASFPFIYAKTPGMAPYDNPYTSAQFPKCIDSEYDFSTGTYKQVMVDWSEVQNRLSTANFYKSYQAVPYVPVTPVERMMH